MKFINRQKRVADIMDKLGVGGMVLGLFPEKISWSGLVVGFMLIILSIAITKED